MSIATKPEGTVYDGPPVNLYSNSTSAAASPVQATGGTVFDETKFVPKRVDASTAVVATTRKVRGASLRFFIVAGLGLAEFFVLKGNGADTSTLFAQVLVIAFFATLGLLGYRLNKGAFLAGILVYGAQTLFLVYVGLQSSLIFVAYAIFVRCTIVYRLYCAYGMICDIESV